MSQDPQAPALADEPSPLLALMTARVGDALLRRPHLVEAATDLATLCRDLSALGATEALVRDGARLGIFTATDLVSAVASGRPAERIAVGELARFEPWTVNIDDPLSEALALMLRHRVHRLLVRQDDQVVAILGQMDLMAFVANHAQLISAEAARAPDIAALTRAATQVAPMIRALAGDGVRVELIAALVGRVNRQIFLRLWELLAPPELIDNSCLIVMGSEGRAEQVMRTDQDNGLILRDGFDFPDLAAITTRFTEALADFGYPPCPGGIMLSRPQWCQSVSGFARSLAEWSLGETADGPMNLAIFLDAAPVAGDAGLLAQLRQGLYRRLAGDDAFLARFALALRQFDHVAPGGWWRRLPGMRGPEAAEIDLKKLGIFPLVHGVRALALQYGIAPPGTADRLRLLAQAGRIDPTLARDLIEALHCMMGLKLAANLAQAAQGRPPDNSIRPVELGRLDRQALRDSLNIVRSFKQWLGLHFHLDML